uniref:Uncharacterized protein n=1 Tax=Rhizophora mucronata TaxID=61149 RepID=A0A2P2QWV1_RHIMU
MPFIILEIGLQLLRLLYPPSNPNKDTTSIHFLYLCTLNLQNWSENHF